MKRTSLIFSALAILATAVLGSSCQNQNNGAANQAAGNGEVVTANAGAIVYYNLDKVLQDYDMANELRSAVETKVQGIQQEVTRRGNKLQSNVNDFQDKINKGLITRSVAEVQGQKLQKEQEDFQRYAAQKEQEIAEEQQVLLNQIGDAIKKYLDKFVAEKQYALVLTTQGDILPSPVAAGDPSLDITEELLAGLNDEYVKNKAKGQ